MGPWGPGREEARAGRWHPGFGLGRGSARRRRRRLWWGVEEPRGPAEGRSASRRSVVGPAGPGGPWRASWAWRSVGARAGRGEGCGKVPEPGGARGLRRGGGPWQGRDGVTDVAGRLGPGGPRWAQRGEVSSGGAGRGPEPAVPWAPAAGPPRAVAPAAAGPPRAVSPGRGPAPCHRLVSGAVPQGSAARVNEPGPPCPAPALPRPAPPQPPGRKWPVGGVVSGRR